MLTKLLCWLSHHPVDLAETLPAATANKIRPKYDLYKYFSGYSPPLTNLAAQTEFSQLQKDCSGSSKDGHGLNLNGGLFNY